MGVGGEHRSGAKGGKGGEERGRVSSFDAAARDALKLESET